MVPLSRKGQISLRTLRELVYPGLEQFGISTEPARAWELSQLG